MKESTQVWPEEYSATTIGAQNNRSVEIEHEEKSLAHAGETGMSRPS